MMSSTPACHNHASVVLLSGLAAVAIWLTMVPPTLAQPDVGGTPLRPADLVIVNAKIWTGAEGTDKKRGPINGEAADTAKREPHPRREPTAIAVVGEAIVGVGDDETIRGRIGTGTTVIDAGGRRVIPGITDSHTHLVSGGFQLARLNLREAKNKEEFLQAIEADAKGKLPGQWILGGRWSVESWENPERPHRDWLDPITADTPAFLTRMDGHQALANSAALKLAGIDAQGPKDPVGGEIERDPTSREPTGVLKESAMELVSARIPPAAVEERLAALHRAVRHAHSLGVTSVHDMSTLDDINTFLMVYAHKKLKLRITSYLQVDDWKNYYELIENNNRSFELLRARAGADAEARVRIAGFKAYMDGSLGSRTAYMRAPFADAVAATLYPRGQLTAFASSESFGSNIREANERGWQVAMHAIGDQANHLLLSAYAQARESGERKNALHRIEHAQHLLVEDIPRFAVLGVVPSMQPYHKADDGRFAEKALGEERLKGSYAFRELLDAGALLCFGSDWPVVTLNPFAGIDAAVNSRTLAGDVWLASSAINVEEALRCYTVNPARAVGRGDKLGTIEAGKVADLVILTEDPLTIPRARLNDVTAWQTIFGGQVVFKRN